MNRQFITIACCLFVAAIFCAPVNADPDPQMEPFKAVIGTDQALVHFKNYCLHGMSDHVEIRREAERPTSGLTRLIDRKMRVPITSTIDAWVGTGHLLSLMAQPRSGRTQRTCVIMANVQGGQSAEKLIVALSRVLERDRPTGIQEDRGQTQAVWRLDTSENRTFATLTLKPAQPSDLLLLSLVGLSSGAAAPAR